MIRLEVGIRLGDGHEASECASEPGLGSCQFAHHLRVAWIRGGAAGSRLGDVAGLGDGFEGFALMLEVALGGFDEVRDEIVAAFELDIDLRESVFEAVPQCYELVVLTDDEEQEKTGNYGQNDQRYQNESHTPHFAAVAVASQ